jgi:hypothetical protein
MGSLAATFNKKNKSNQLDEKIVELTLKFRTITTLLQHLQRYAPIPELDVTSVTPREPTKGDRHDLRFLTALAVALVRKSEVTAVVGGGIGTVLELLVALDAELAHDSLKPVIATINPLMQRQRKNQRKTRLDHVAEKAVITTPLAASSIDFNDPLAFVKYTTVCVPHVTPLLASD